MQTEKKIGVEMVEIAKKFLVAIDQIEIVDVVQAVIIKFNKISIAIDLQIEIRLARKNITLNFEFILEGSPQKVRNSLLRMTVVKTNYPNSYSILIAPYLSREALNICQDHGIGGIDQSGNSFFKINGIHIHKTGFKNLFPIRRSRGRLLSNKETRLPRVLLAYPGKMWSVTKLSEAAQISYGLCWDGVQKMKDRSIIEFDRKKIKLKNIENLIGLWIRAYTVPDVTVCLYSKENSKSIVSKITNYFSEKKVNCAFTSTAAASLLFYGVDVTNIDVYLDGPLIMQDIIDSLIFTTVPDKDSHQINIITYVDPAVFWYNQTIKDVTIVSDIQIYIDLMQDRSPLSKDLARKILHKKILKAWTE